MTTPSYRNYTGTAAETYQRHFVPAIAIPVSAGSSPRSSSNRASGCSTSPAGPA